MFATLLFLLTVGCLCGDVINKEGADKIRESGATWEVVNLNESIFKNMTMDEFSSKFLKEWPSNSSLPELDGNQIKNYSRHLQELTAIPEKFDARKEWGNCIHLGKDQGECRGCWAFGITNHLSDRFCISGQDVILSVQDMLECTTGNKCCDGGSAENAYKYMIQIGIVSEDCKSFDSRCNECRPSSCKRYKCIPNSAWVTNDITIAKWEILMNGPITGIYEMYADFAYYKGGVYYNTTNESIFSFKGN